MTSGIVVEPVYKDVRIGRSATEKRLDYFRAQIGDKVYEPIPNREILPMVEDLTSKALAADKQYWAGNPTQFIDKGGNVWKR